ncbi:MAG: hypothetical protein A2664_04125 [Candidatus Taylorbacteria bacterium RIFCSPHIGHO2_01_FULL_46_22b]|uniref:Serine protease n=1 Tax=Candidatus Taylorbacteria bacterium RIFCSPHIGHO2_01_FULL_46_22b TaxID=1802301 RepID=A0A1G2M1M8_9BACT|nr:MAG: hypothetical protein A2664_04125 [Candidatus Taylorbacteria bacterium RIFCSPHIGHO2_01_FULL_46_22b]
MENLTKQQIVLVTLLVSFITSIATGIVTVALMDQVPQGMTQTINRVVERTIEKVVQVPTQSAAVVTKETVVVKEDDLIVSSIEENTPSIVRFSMVGSDGQKTPAAFGIILSKDGLVLADSWQVFSDAHYTVELASGASFPVDRLISYEATQTVLFKIKLPEGSKISLQPVVLADSDKLKLGQTVVYIGGLETNSVGTGLISNLRTKTVTLDASSTEPQVPAPVTDITSNIRVGSADNGVLTNLSAEVIAFKLSGEAGPFLPSNKISSLLAGYMTAQASSTKAR